MSVCNEQSKKLVEFVVGLLLVLIDTHSVVGRADKVWSVPGSQCGSLGPIRLLSPSLEAEQILWISSPSGRESRRPPTDL